MPRLLSLPTRRAAGCAAPILFFATLFLAGVSTACGDAGEAPAGKSESEVAGEDGGAAQSGTSGAATAPDLESLAPPPPAPALNVYTEECLSGELPAADAELRKFSAACMQHLLETLRAVIGTAQVPQAEVGPRLDEAEVAVRHLGIEVSSGDFPARVRTAALSLVELAAAIGEVVPGAEAGQIAGGEAEREARAAAEAIDPETPLAGQAQPLSRFLRTADGQVRPLVRHLSRLPAGGAEGGPDGDVES